MIPEDLWLRSPSEAILRALRAVLRASPTKAAAARFIRIKPATLNAALRRPDYAMESTVRKIRAAAPKAFRILARQEYIRDQEHRRERAAHSDRPCEYCGNVINLASRRGKRRANRFTPTFPDAA